MLSNSLPSALTTPKKGIADGFSHVNLAAPSATIHALSEGTRAIEFSRRWCITGQEENTSGAAVHTVGWHGLRYGLPGVVVHTPQGGRA